MPDGRAIALLLALAAAGAGVWRWQRGDAAPAARYRTAVVARQELVVRVNAPGTLDVRDPVVVAAPFAARVRRVLVEEEQRVEAGGVLAELDTEALGAATAVAAAERRRASALARQAAAAVRGAEAALARARRLAAQGLAGRATIESLEGELAHARAAQAAAAAAVEGAGATARDAGARAARGELRAPAAGVVLRAEVAAGDPVRPDGPPLFVIAPRLDQLRLTAQIDEADVAAVAPGARATFTVPAWPGRSFTATLVRVRRAPTRAGGGVSYAAQLDAVDPDGALRPGMTASVTIEVARRPDALVVPEAALRWSPDGSAGGRARIHVLDAAATPRALAVRAGLSDGTATEIAAGPLEPGDRVIIGSAGGRSRGGLELGARR
jgi:HlyD family secretion protein